MTLMPWPEGYNAAASFTFDFDAETVWVGLDPANANRPGVLSIGSYGARVGVHLILDVLARRSVKATFFVVGRNAELYPAVIERMLADGHEVAIHGYTHTPPAQLTPAEEEGELVKARRALEILGAKISGYRSPSWDVSPVTLDLLVKHKIAYSSQFMANIRPYRHESHALMELPIQWLLDDWHFFAFGPGQMDRPIQSAATVETIWAEEFEGIYGLNGHFILTMHPQVIGRPSRVIMLERLIDKICARKDVWIATCAEVAAYAEKTLPGVSR
jgi:peptidoglycan/xylan/chitin deacetylase (PgdA/CDA1 family)